MRKAPASEPVTIFDYGVFEAEGRNLAQELRGGPFRVDRAVRIAFEVCRSLQEAHELGIVHRDLKTSNIMLATTSEALVRVESDPPGAEVFVDRTDLGSRGRTPMVLALPPGEHAILLELPAHLPASLPTVAEKGTQKTVTAALEAILGSARVQGAPVGAEIHLGEEGGPLLGALPASVSLPPGRHVLVVTAPGCATRRELVEVRANEVTDAVVDLELVLGRLVVAAVVSEALIEVDGVAAGFTPTVLELPVGHHTVRVSRRGYQPFVEEVDVAVDQGTNLDVTLRPLTEVTGASRAAESIDEAPASVTVVSEEEIRAFGYVDVHDALGGTRGVFRTNDLTYGSLGFRGFRASRTTATAS